MKKLITSLLAAAVMITTVPFAGVAAQTDYATRGEVVQMLLIAADDYNPQVQKTDIIKGYEDGKLHEDNAVTRAEALIKLNRAFGGFPKLTGNNLRIAIPKEDFTDIPKWTEDELAPVFDAGIVAGTAQGTFSPDENVTKEQMKLFISRVYTIYGSNPKDNFYAFVNKEKLDTLQIPAGRTAAGTLHEVRDKTEAQVLELIKQAAASQPEDGSPQEKIKILYDNITDMEARDAAGYNPIKGDLAAIAQVQSVSELAELSVLAGYTCALDIMTSFNLTVDSADSNSYIPIFAPAAASQARQVYTGDAEVQKRAYLNYITTLLTLCGQEPEEAAANAEAYFAFEKQLSDASLTIAEQYDITKTYNLYTLKELDDIFAAVDLAKVFAQTGMKGESKILVQDVGHMQQLADMLTDENLAAVKNYLSTKLILSCADFFGTEFRQANITFQQEALGIDGSKTVEQEAADTVSAALPDYIGQVYAETYCSNEMIADITGMIADVTDIYRSRIQNLSWMSNATKEKALFKLDTMIVNVGAPDYDKVKSPLDQAELKSAAEGGSYFQNMMEISKAKMADNARLSSQPVDKTQWIATPQTVNAFYFPSFNSINFPAAFMQAPIYDINASYEEKLGAVGTVIGHEMTHAFDSNGSQYDEKGNAADWWTQEDKAAFKALCDEVAAFFDGQESAPGILIDGELTLTENIADLGALSCVTEIGAQTPGFDFKKMFESYAVLWATTSSREKLQNDAYTDVHSPATVRVNRVLQTLEAFYEAYGIGETDGMYVPPQERVRIW